MEIYLEENKKSLINSTNISKTGEKKENVFNIELNTYISPIEDQENKKNVELFIQDNMLPLTDRKKSSDSTSISISQEEILSQTSECSLFCSHSNNPQPINSTPIASNDLYKEEKNYFYGIENYFYKLMPEKFSEYKKSKNFLPKKINNLKEEPIYEKEKENIKENDIKIEDNKNNQNYSIANNFYYPIYGNIFYYAYNNFYLNYPNINNNINTNNNYQESKVKNKDSNNIEPKKSEKKDFDKSTIEQDVNIYIIKKVKKNYNKNSNNNNGKTKKNNYSEIISSNCNYSKNNYNYNNRYKNCNYKNYNNSYNQRNDYYYKLNENKKEQRKNNYNNNYYNNKKPRKIIYY